jgi:peptide subunit release factor 1 (eRF1)
MKRNRNILLDTFSPLVLIFFAEKETITDFKVYSHVKTENNLIAGHVDHLRLNEEITLKLPKQ